MQLC
jgi:hypothetical protein